MRLVFAREVQVDIRNLVPFKPQERLKRNVVAVFSVGRSALRTVFVRQIKSRTDRSVVEKLGMAAIRTDVMRWQRVDLGNFRQCCDKGRTDRSPRTDEIAVIKGAFYKLMRDQIDDGESVADYAFQLFFDPFSTISGRSSP